MKIHVRQWEINWNSSRKQNIYDFPKRLISLSLDASSHAKTIYYCSQKFQQSTSILKSKVSMGNLSSWQLKSTKLQSFKYHNMTKKNSMKWLRYFFPSLTFYHQGHVKWLKNIILKTRELRIFGTPQGFPATQLFVECSCPGRLHLFTKQEQRDPIRY